MDLNTILDPIKEMAYPSGFSMETLKSIPSYKKRLEYVESMLTKIASGSARTVYKVDEEKVLKVAKNKKGLAQNQAESDWGAQQCECTARVFDRDENGLFIEMELARKVTPTKFKELVKVSIENIWTYLDIMNDLNNGNHVYLDNDDKAWLEELHNNEWVQDLMSFIYDYGYPYPGDFGRLSTYGIVSHEGRESIVLIDFGLTKDVLDTHYSHR